MVILEPVGPSRFVDVVSTIEDLRALVGVPGDGAVRKDIGRIDTHAAGFIARAPYMMLATSGADGRCDVSPRGDGPGFVRVLDEQTLLIPERPGNRRVDSLANIIENPHVGLFFLVPGWQDTLRVNGRAQVIRDAGLLEGFAVNGKTPLLAIAVHVEECYLHCAKSIRRSRIWEHGQWTPREQFPSTAQIAIDQLNLTDCTVEDLAASMEQSNQRLY